MDYKTKPVSRKELHCFALFLRELFDVPPTGKFPVLTVLDRLGDIFPNCNYEVVEDNLLPTQTVAQCIENGLGGFTIEIKEYVYNGAYKGIGAYRGFICHEICHILLHTIGYKPVLECSFENNKLRAYESVEWQAKALCGEVMIPFEESRGMNVKTLINTYGVSKGFAEKRILIERKRGNMIAKK